MPGFRIYCLYRQWMPGVLSESLQKKPLCPAVPLPKRMDRIQLREMFGSPFRETLRCKTREVAFSIKRGKAALQFLSNELMAAEHFTFRDVDLTYLPSPVIYVSENLSMEIKIRFCGTFDRKLAGLNI